jgi:hypothetical protein
VRIAERGIVSAQTHARTWLSARPSWMIPPGLRDAWYGWEAAMALPARYSDGCLDTMAAPRADNGHGGMGRARARVDTSVMDRKEGRDRNARDGSDGCARDDSLLARSTCLARRRKQLFQTIINQLQPYFRVVINKKRPTYLPTYLPTHLVELQSQSKQKGRCAV